MLWLVQLAICDVWASVFSHAETGNVQSFQCHQSLCLRISVCLVEWHERKSSSASWAGYPTGGLWTIRCNSNSCGNRTSLVRLHESAERSTVIWREKSRGKKRGRKAVPSHPQARREGNGKLLLTHFIWQLVSCLWISLTRCQATGAKFRRPHSCCIQRKEAARQKGPTWLVLYGPLLRPGAPVPLTGASHDYSHVGSLPDHVPVHISRDWRFGIRAAVNNYFIY